jgi:hypothetical protein
VAWVRPGLKRPSSRAHAAAFHHRGQAFAAKGNLDQAISNISARIRVDPQPAYRWQERGELYARQGKYQIDRLALRRRNADASKTGPRGSDYQSTRQPVDGVDKPHLVDDWLSGGDRHAHSNAAGHYSTSRIGESPSAAIFLISGTGSYPE